MRARKLRKKWGNIKRSDKTKLEDMLEHHKDEVQAYLLRKKAEFEQRMERKSQNNAAAIDDNPLQRNPKTPPLQSPETFRSTGPLAAPAPPEINNNSNMNNGWRGSGSAPPQGVGSTRRSSTPKSMPKVGYFSVGTTGHSPRMGSSGSPAPKSPRSPFKNSFRKD